jgi:hypothetical protein
MKILLKSDTEFTFPRKRNLKIILKNILHPSLLSQISPNTTLNPHALSLNLG